MAHPLTNRRPFGSALLMHVVAALDQMEGGGNLDAVSHDPDVSAVFFVEPLTTHIA